MRSRMQKFALVFLTPWIIMIMVLDEVRATKRRRLHGLLHEEAEEWAQNWIEENKEILEKFD
jgi:hypothetical protein